jgi:hypothetical protein
MRGPRDTCAMSSLPATRSARLQRGWWGKTAHHGICWGGGYFFPSHSTFCIVGTYLSLMRLLIVIAWLHNRMS